MNAKNLKTYVAPALLALATLTQVTPASAQFVDNKAYAGAGCIPVNQANQAFASIQGGAITNISDTGTLSVSCPVVRDNTLISAKGITHATVTVLDVHPTAIVSCTLQARDHTNKVMSSASDNSSNFGPNEAGLFGTLLLISSKPVTPVNNGFLGGIGAYTLNCSIPPAAVVNGQKKFSSITRYDISEHVRDQTGVQNVDLEP